MARERSRALLDRLDAEATSGGYLLNPDVDFVMELMDGLVANQDRYGYLACPCRLAEGVRERDLDLICPCDYRDPDLEEFGTCYCALYVSEAVARGEQKLRSIPERRPAERPVPAADGASRTAPSRGAQTVWRCIVCGYLCARPEPPLKCPICKVDRDRFELFERLPVWRCTVCGYLCARPEPPLKCPVCKVDKDRFEPFL